MAQHNRTEDVQNLLNAGWTAKEIEDRFGWNGMQVNLDKDGNLYEAFAWNRAVANRFDGELEEMLNAKNPNHGGSTVKQVKLILKLLAERRASGSNAGFINGPTTEEEIYRLTKRQASRYIESLLERY